MCYDTTASETYVKRLKAALDMLDLNAVAVLKEELKRCWLDRRHVFICGNGGSAANAMHVANDLHYGCSKTGLGLKVQALTANPVILTCLANDLSFDEIFSNQLAVHAEADDLLIAFSGSGNSNNIILALKQASAMNTPIPR